MQTILASPPSAHSGFTAHPRRFLVVFAVSAALLMLVQWRFAVANFPHDSMLYWALATNPLGVPPEMIFRGYVFPALMGSVVWLLTALGLSGLDAYKVFASCLYAAGLGLLLPAAYQRLVGGQVSLLRSVSLVGLVALFFPGLMVYPLSDLPALVAMWLCVYLVFRSHEQAGKSDDRLAAIGWIFLAGIAAGVAYNTRTIYLFSTLLVGLAVLLHFDGRRHYVLYLCLGFALTCAPQMLLNQRLHGIASPDPSAAFSPGKGSLFAKQLAWGITVQKYETAIAPDAPSASLMYFDPAGKALQAKVIAAAHPLGGGKTTANTGLDSIVDYLVVVTHHPVDFLALYMRHFVNGIDVRDGDAYVSQPSAQKIRTSFVAFGLLLLCLLAVHAAGTQAPNVSNTEVPSRATRWSRGLFTLALICPSLAAIPGAMETRFMLPLLLYLWVAASCKWSVPAMMAEVRARPLMYLALAVLAYSVFFAITQSTMASLQTPWIRK